MSKTNNCKICATPGGTNLVLHGFQRTSLGFFCRPCQSWVRHIVQTVVRNVSNLVKGICAPSRKVLAPIKPAIRRREKRHAD